MCICGVLYRTCWYCIYWLINLRGNGHFEGKRMPCGNPLCSNAERTANFHLFFLYLNGIVISWSMQITRNKEQSSIKKLVKNGMTEKDFLNLLKISSWEIKPIIDSFSYPRIRRGIEICWFSLWIMSRMKEILFRPVDSSKEESLSLYSFVATNAEASVFCDFFFSFPALVMLVRTLTRFLFVLKLRERMNKATTQKFALVRSPEYRCFSFYHISSALFILVAHNYKGS